MKHILHKFLSISFALLLLIPCKVKADDEFLTELYDQLHDSPLQQKFRHLAPMPFGVVFLPWKGCTEKEMREHFRMMKKLGFTNLKQTMGTPEWPEQRTLEIALEEGIIPFWYGEAGWEDITSELLEKLGLPKDMKVSDARTHPVMIDYQNKVLANQLKAKPFYLPADSLYNHSFDSSLSEKDKPPFREWIRNQYSNVNELADAWNQYEVGISHNPYKSWDDFYNDPLMFPPPIPGEMFPSGVNEYGRIRDILRFKADMYVDNIRKTRQPAFEGQPQRAGGEMGLFLPFASRGTDMEGIADVMTELGAFYPSIHLAWHLEETDYEVARCIYMQSSICTDWFKGGWAATFESTGGPQQFSGGKGWTRVAQESTAGFTVDGGVMTQLLLSYLAGGFKGVGLWSWNARRAGWESGEYALLDRQNQPTDRTIAAGNIAKAANKYRDELWHAHKQPIVGVFVNWDNEAIWAAISGPNRNHFKNYPIQARIGISRALIDANVEWEHVTANDLKKGLAGRYKVIYLPAHVAINEELFPIFEKYVANGGRLIIDAPGAWWNERGHLLDTSTGSSFENLFGCSIRDFQYANNVKYSIEGHYLNGFFMDLKPTSAQVTEYTDQGFPLVVENSLGKGKAIILANDASFSMCPKGNEFMEEWTVNTLLGPYKPTYSCQEAIVYKLAAPEADHFFLINDGPKTEARLSCDVSQYNKLIDAITGEELTIGDPVALDANSGRWLRYEK